MKHTASKPADINTSAFYDDKLLNKDYNFNKELTGQIGYNANVLESFYGARNEAIVFYDEARERIEKKNRKKEKELSR
ncbi:hypothetical protein ACER0A_013010 [Haloimpatiens sp. FM7315]|uniref:hypothetical protein n=1 Tax=Haloimpatiens sp. FM7315 TaxID=3298609 RepID=UPI00370B9EB2